MKPLKNGHQNSSSSKRDELERATVGAANALDLAKERLNRLIEELNKPRPDLKTVRVGRGERGDVGF